MTMFLDSCWMAEVFGDIRNNQSRGKCYRPRPTILIISDITMQKLNLATVFVTRYCFEEKKIMKGKHLTVAQNTD